MKLKERDIQQANWRVALRHIAGTDNMPVNRGSAYPHYMRSNFHLRTMSLDPQKKLRITAGTSIRTVHAPVHYAKTIGALPKGATITKGITRSHGFIHLFVKNKAELEREIDKAAKALAPDALLWISYPKGGKTDLTRDKGWECLEKLTMQWLALISFDADWSAFLMKNAPPKEDSKASKDYHAAQQEWADAKTKTVRIPDDLAAVFKKNGEARRFYEALAYTNRKEYVLWVVGAKREETRAARVKGTIEKLLAGMKNPSGR